MTANSHVKPFAPRQTTGVRSALFARLLNGQQLTLRRLGLFQKGKRRSLRVAFTYKQVVIEIKVVIDIKKAEALVTHEECKTI